LVQRMGSTLLLLVYQNPIILCPMIVSASIRAVTALVIGIACPVSLNLSVSPVS